MWTAYLVIMWIAYRTKVLDRLYGMSHKRPRNSIYRGERFIICNDVCVCYGAETLPNFYQKAIETIGIERICCCNFIYVDSAFIHEDELPWLTFRVIERSNKWYQSSGRGVHTTTAYICRNLSFLLTFSHTFSVFSGSNGQNCLKFEYNV